MDRFGRMIEAEGRAATLRKLGGLLFGMGMFMVFLRKGSNNFDHNWGSFLLFLVLAVPAVVLYGLGLRGERLQPSGAVIGELAPWRIVFLVFGLLLVPLALFQFIDMIGGTPGATLNVAWVFGVTAALAVVASHEGRATYMSLLAGLALVVVWTALIDKIFNINDGHTSLYRWSLLILAGIFAAAAASLANRADPLDNKRSNELVTVAGITAVLAAGLSIATIVGLTSGVSVAPGGIKSTLLWEIVLLVVSVALVAYGSYRGARGPSYVGAIGIFIFLLVAGFDLNGDPPDGKVIGWPLLLVIAGGAALALSLRPEPGVRRPAATPAATPAAAGAPDTPAAPPAGAPTDAGAPGTPGAPQQPGSGADPF
ncbi:MAG: hypothetical protein QOJ38_2025 [Solirubrobacterales bacterium]|jgi:hypothetical protein|nr:hypothetical protein [Solirubrobacterales bacterium]